MPKIIRSYKEVGYCALALAIIKGYTPESALEYIEDGKIKFYRFNSSDDVINMIRLRVKEGLSYAKIGEIYDLKPDNVYSKIRRFKEKRGTEDMQKMRKAGFRFYEIGEFYGMSPQGIQQRLKRKGWNKARGEK